MKREEVAKIIQEEIDSVRAERKGRFAFKELRERKRIIEEIVEAFAPEVCENGGRFKNFTGLMRCLKRFDVQHLDAEMIFKMIKSKYENSQESGISTDSIQEAAVNYFVHRIMDKIESFGPDIQAALSYVKRRRYAVESSKSEFLKPALKAMQERLEMEVELEKQEREYKSILAIASEEKGIKKHKDARLERVVLTVNYLLSGAGVTEDCQKSKRINFIDFVSPYSRNTIKPQIDKLHEKASEDPLGYAEDMKMIRGYFEALGLNKIVEQIDRDLEFET